MNKKLIAGMLLTAILAFVPVFKVFSQDAVVPAPDVVTDDQVVDEETPGACMSAAVDVRDTALLAGYETMTAAVKKALQDRRTALMAAWAKAKDLTRAGLQDTKLEVAAANKAYAAAVKTARAEFAKVKASTWKLFNAERIKCKVTAQMIKAESQTADKSL